MLMRRIGCLTAGVFCALAGFLVFVCAAEAAERGIQDKSAWQRWDGNLLWNLHNVYQPCVVKVSGQEYPYKMWLMGWAAEDSNPGFPGSDAIFHARSRDLKRWEVYGGRGRWVAPNRPQLWVPVVTAGDEPYDAWHNGDPSVVYKDGVYYMAFSTTGRPDMLKGHPNGGQLSCVMGATSSDGIHWQKTTQPLLVESERMQKTLPREAAEWVGVFHRPSLMWDQGKWRLWFDYAYYRHGRGRTHTGYAENDGQFGAAGGFRMKHEGAEPVIQNWPNPEMVKIGTKYHSFSDPGGYPGKRGWASRQLCEAVSDDGLKWEKVGYIEPDDDAPACQVPQTFVTEMGGRKWLYVFYATQKGGEPYDYRYGRIRAIRRQIKGSPGGAIQDSSLWHRSQQNKLSGFYNMYNPHVIEEPGETYPYKMWFFGWSVTGCNPGYSGCDSIFFARSTDLENWKVYCGSDQWDDGVGGDPNLWEPVLTADDKYYDEWHNGDPSVVRLNGVYYMAYSSTGMDLDGYHSSNENDTDGYISCVMGASSTDGINWTRSSAPIMIYDDEIGELENYNDPSYCGNFHRPSLMRDGGIWRLWFDYKPLGGTALSMGYAECSGDFMNPNEWTMKNDMNSPLIENWPNPDVVKVGETYYCFSDPSGYPGQTGWPRRQMRQAVSSDGINWDVATDYIDPDSDTPACQVPEAFVTTVNGRPRLYLFYACQVGGKPYNYHFNRIRFMWKDVYPSIATEKKDYPGLSR